MNQISVRMAWALASHDMLEFVASWRESAAIEQATDSAQSEMAAFDAGDELIYNAFENDSEAYVGRIDLHSWGHEAPRCEIGYMADARTCGRGLLRDGALACIKLAFDMGAIRVQALTDANNTRALRFAAALGMQQEGVLRNYGRHNGIVHDEIMFSRLRGIGNEEALSCTP
jgi:RimJ/RimL family protein N-acetyltransferase